MFISILVLQDTRKESLVLLDGLTKVFIQMEIRHHKCDGGGTL